MLVCVLARLGLKKISHFGNREDIMALNTLAVKHAKPKDRCSLIKDEKGLYIKVMPTGNKF